jgi:hypothetical protein
VAIQRGWTEKLPFRTLNVAAPARFLKPRTISWSRRLLAACFCALALSRAEARPRSLQKCKLLSPVVRGPRCGRARTATQARPAGKLAGFALSYQAAAGLVARGRDRRDHNYRRRGGLLLTERHRNDHERPFGLFQGVAGDASESVDRYGHLFLARIRNRGWNWKGLLGLGAGSPQNSFSDADRIVGVQV